MPEQKITNHDTQDTQPFDRYAINTRRRAINDHGESGYCFAGLGIAHFGILG